ncbi:UDP-glucose 4-epimerase GalE [Streptacidiphilus sp. PB12-B1b]|uniref:UDP-glucose 4-epimerase GalE n=1 Tax=Streptacidiphilus sp. PB12-B1b TaxID=2705012 RepID=UPI0015F8C716|nr:UDP-glucose 4-epimerase GalE [Streptacidiphilus sp. PB12-B1b]QMU76010.1 UDP-glucose 4-epimerase GalE [Streptacidiphilus sp. PB12-B1b]
MKVLITGGAGFIGSTVASACLDHGITPVILDNLVTGRREFTGGRDFYEGDIADGPLLDRIFAEHPDIDAAIHCAALIVVPESVAEPLRYYRENVAKTVSLLEHLQRNGCDRLLFSSSASIYTPGEDFTVDESSALDPLSPYARTKMLMELVFKDTAEAKGMRVLSLRYFNPIGADPQLRTGLQAAAPSHALGKLIEARRSGEPFRITGTDWPTRDGSGIRDYVHVWDLARAHVAALQHFDEALPADGPGRYEVINLGTGEGTTVRELVAAFETVTGAPLPTEEAGPRPGDNAGAFTRSDKAARLLDWRPELSLEQGIADTLAWFSRRQAVLA